jgi:hypothetical protein
MRHRDCIAKYGGNMFQRAKGVNTKNIIKFF